MIKPPEITDSNLWVSIRRLEIISTIKDVLPAQEKEIVARLRMTLHIMPWLARQEIDCLLIEKLIVKKKSVCYSTPRFEFYVKDLSSQIQKYKIRTRREQKKLGNTIYV